MGGKCLEGASAVNLNVSLQFVFAPRLPKVALCNDSEEKEDKQQQDHRAASRVSRYTSAADGLHWMCAPSRSVHRGCATD